MNVDLDDLSEPNGAHFVAADLHVHTFGGSGDVKDPQLTPERVVEAAVKKGLSIIAITDHNNTKNIERALKAARKHEGSLIVIPGVEVTSSNGHLLAYFPTIDKCNKFLGRVDIIGSGSDSDGHTEMSMASVLTQVAALDGFAIAAHIDRKKSGFERFSAGYQGAKRDIMVSAALRGVEIDDSANLAFYSPDDAGETASERKKLLKARADSGVHSSLAHIQSSDAHTLAQFQAAPIGTRIKVDELTYEAVSLAFKDPEARIRATHPLPRNYAKIHGLAIEGGFLHGLRIHFNQNLNCFIGGRGTGKSTVLRALAHVLDCDPDFAQRSDYPRAILAFVEDEHGLMWRFEKKTGQSAVASAQSDPTNVIDVSSFPIEYYPQNALAKVSENLTVDGALLQQFLDRHLHADDLMEQEAAELAHARELAAQLEPVERTFDALPSLLARLKNVDLLLRSAEEGKLKDVVAWQAALANEIAAIDELRRGLAEVRKKIQRFEPSVDVDEALKRHEPLLQTAPSKRWRESTVSAFKTYNESEASLEEKMLKVLDRAQTDFEAAAKEVIDSHDRLRRRIAAKIQEFESKGLKASTQDLAAKVRMRSQLADQIAAVQSRKADLERLRANRSETLERLRGVRAGIEKIRSEQLQPINRSLAQTIDQFRVVFLYEPSGHTRDFCELLFAVMTGTRLRDEDMRQIARCMSPAQLADLCERKDDKALAAVLVGIEVEQRWATDLIKRFSERKNLYELQTCWKPPCVRIKILTRTQPAQEIPVANLSDGQRHTILLTVAMLSKSPLPLLIDQPEDDLDNAFISKTVVGVLRAVKEKRQVILVTHNANLAVLGDSELLLPMQRTGEIGQIFNAGSLDRDETRDAIETILEGGRDAFRRRGELYHVI